MKESINLLLLLLLHRYLRPDNVLWNKELKRALIIDFYRAEDSSLVTVGPLYMQIYQGSRLNKNKKNCQGSGPDGMGTKKLCATSRDQGVKGNEVF